VIILIITLWIEQVTKIENNYKKFTIQQRITELMKALKNYPNSPFRGKREAELEKLKKELDE